eukprot:5305159-Prymnesium_polylepis.1
MLGDRAVHELEPRAADGRRRVPRGDGEHVEHRPPAGAYALGARLRHVAEAAEDELLDLQP